MSVSKEVSKKVEEEASEGITLYCHHHITVLLFSNYYYEGEKQLWKFSIKDIRYNLNP